MNERLNETSTNVVDQLGRCTMVFVDEWFFPEIFSRDDPVPKETFMTVSCPSIRFAWSDHRPMLMWLRVGSWDKTT